jgi:hypothetical protein
MTGLEDIGISRVELQMINKAASEASGSLGDLMRILIRYNMATKIPVYKGENFKRLVLDGLGKSITVCDD